MKLHFLQKGNTITSLEDYNTDWNDFFNTHENILWFDPANSGPNPMNNVSKNKYHHVGDRLKAVQQLALLNGKYDYNTFRKNADKLYSDYQAAKGIPTSHLIWNSDSLNTESIEPLIRAVLWKRGAREADNDRIVQMIVQGAKNHAGIVGKGENAFDATGFGERAATIPYSGHVYHLGKEQRKVLYRDPNTGKLREGLFHNTLYEGADGGRNETIFSDADGNYRYLSTPASWDTIKSQPYTTLEYKDKGTGWNLSYPHDWENSPTAGLQQKYINTRHNSNIISPNLILKMQEQSPIPAAFKIGGKIVKPIKIR